MDVSVRVHEDFDLGGGVALAQGIHDVPIEDLPNYESVILDGTLFFPLEIKELDSLNQQFNEQIYNLYKSDLAIIETIPPFNFSLPSPADGDFMVFDTGFWTNRPIEALDIPNLDAAKITSGVFGHARLGSGGGGSAKFLREDSTYQTISVGLTIGNAVSGGGANRLLGQDASQNLQAWSNLTTDGNTLTISNSGTATKTSLNLNFGGGYSVNAQNRLDFDTACRIASEYAVSQGNDGLWLKFYTGADFTNYALALRADKTAVFGGSLVLSNGLTISHTSAPILTLTDNRASHSAADLMRFQLNTGYTIGDEASILFKSGGTSLNSIATFYGYDGSYDFGFKFYTGNGSGIQGSPAVTIHGGSSTYGDNAAQFAGNIILADAKNFVFGTSTGTKIGTGSTQKLAFWNATPVTQRTTFVVATNGIAVGIDTVDLTALTDTVDDILMNIDTIKQILTDIGITN